MTTRWLLALAAAGALALPACSSSSAGTGAPAAAGSSHTVDACSLLTPAEVTAMVPGAPDRGEPAGSDCSWEDPATYESVTVKIGDPRTAAGGTLPASPYDDAVAGPDGIRFGMGNTIAEFVAGDRWCEVQIVKLRTDTRPLLVATVGKLRQRVVA